MVGLITEFLDPPEPRHSPVSVDLAQLEQEAGVQGPTALPAEDYFFGPMRILGRGRCFMMGAQGATVPTATTWVRQAPQGGQAGHCYVVESVPYVLLKAKLAALPPGQGQGQGMLRRAPSLRTMLASVPQAPARPPAAANPMALARVAKRPGPALVLDYILAQNDLLNINFGGVAGAKVGPAAVGQSATDYWNPCYYPWWNTIPLNNLVWANGTASAVNATVANGAGDWASGVSDPMMSTYIYCYGGDITITLDNLPEATYDFYLYGHDGGSGNGVFQLSCGQTQSGPLSTAVSDWDSLPTWYDGFEYRGVPGHPRGLRATGGDHDHA